MYICKCKTTFHFLNTVLLCF